MFYYLYFSKMFKNNILLTSREYKINNIMTNAVSIINTNCKNLNRHKNAIKVVHEASLLFMS